MPPRRSRGTAAAHVGQTAGSLRHRHAAKGQPAAEYEVGTRYIEGNGVPQNTDEGIRWLDRAAKAGIRAR